MGDELSTPVDGTKWPIASLRKVSTDRFSSYAVLAGESLISINFDQLLPGDVVLFEGGKEADSRAIAAYQATVCGASYKNWTHVAILDSTLNMWDAWPNLHVRSRPLREVLREKSNIRVCRPSVAIDSNKLDRALLDFSNHQYKIFKYETANLLFERFRNSSIETVAARRQHAKAQKNVICSSFVANVLRRATGAGFFRDVLVVVPADFLTSTLFTSVDLHWCEIVLSS